MEEKYQVRKYVYKNQEKKDPEAVLKLRRQKAREKYYETHEYHPAHQCPFVNKVTHLQCTRMTKNQYCGAHRALIERISLIEAGKRAVAAPSAAPENAGN